MISSGYFKQMFKTTARMPKNLSITSGRRLGSVLQIFDYKQAHYPPPPPNGSFI